MVTMYDLMFKFGYVSEARVYGLYHVDNYVQCYIYTSSRSLS